MGINIWRYSMTETPTTRRAARTKEEAPELLPDYFARIDKGKLLTHQEEVDLSKRAKAGDEKARDLGGQEVPWDGPSLRGPYSRGQPWSHEGGREVRSRPRVALLDLRDLVGKAGSPEGGSRQEQDNPGPRAHGREDSQDGQGLQRALRRARA